MGGHGTHVASTIGEDANNAIAEAGIAYNVKIMPVKVLKCYWDMQFLRAAMGIQGYAPFVDPTNPAACLGEETTIAQGIRYAANNGARVINLSLGGPAFSSLEQEAINYAVSKGVFVAISAGNDYANGNKVQYPAAYAASIDGAMAVAAVGKSLRHAFYSNSGSYIEIAAPGGDDRDGGSAGKIYQATIPQADQTYATDEILSYQIFHTTPRFDQYFEVADQGTSMASPHVAGIAALIMSQLGSAATPALVERIIKTTARPCDAVDCDPATPASGPVGRNDFFGFGFIQPRAGLLGFGFTN
jgi:serine protease